jgi:protein-tyrosine phosphatase
MFQPELYWVREVEPHRLAIMPKPSGGDWLEDDVAGWQRASIGTVVSLLEPHEVLRLELQQQGALCERFGIEFLQHPIVDHGLPASDAELVRLVHGLHERLRQGRAVAIHCFAGIGRTGLVAGCLLHLLGVPRRDIFRVLGRTRGYAMPNTAAQAEWVERFIEQHPGLEKDGHRPHP